MNDEQLCIGLITCRFSHEEKSKRDPMVYLPFGHGPRSCIGMRFALEEIKLGLCHLLTNFNFFPIPETIVSPIIIFLYNWNKIILTIENCNGMCECLKSCFFNFFHRIPPNSRKAPLAYYRVKTFGLESRDWKNHTELRIVEFRIYINIVSKSSPLEITKECKKYFNHWQLTTIMFWN